MHYKWETVCNDRDHRVRRMAIPEGYLYQIQTGSRLVDRNLERYEPTWGETTFVKGGL